MLEASRRMLACPVIAAALFAASGCGDDAVDSSTSLTPDDLVGTFYLDSIAGQPLPYTIGSSTKYSVLLELRNDETLTWTIDSGSCNSALNFCGENKSSTTGRWLLLFDGRLEVTGSGWQTGDESRAIPRRDRIAFPSGAIYKRVSANLTARSIDIRPDSIMLPVGETRNVFATTVPYVPSIALESRDTTIVRLTGPAVIALDAGTTYIVASAGSLRDSARVVVTP